MQFKLDGVGPVDNRPSTNKLHYFVKKKEKKKWHMTCDIWRVTRDMWHETCCGGWTFCQNLSSLALTVNDLWFYEYLEDQAVKGLINIYIYFFLQFTDKNKYKETLIILTLVLIDALKWKLCVHWSYHLTVQKLVFLSRFEQWQKKSLRTGLKGTVLLYIFFLESGHHGAIDLWNNSNLPKYFCEK